MIPVRLDDCEVPFSFQSIQWVNFPSDYNKLLSSLQSRAGGIPVTKKSTAKKTTKKSIPSSKGKSRTHVTNVKGNINVGGNYINGNQHNTNTTQIINNYSSSAEYVTELQKLSAEIEALKSKSESSATGRLAAAGIAVDDAIEESQKEEPDGEKIKTMLDGAKETMQKLSGSITAAVGLGTTLGNLALMALKLFGK